MSSQLVSTCSDSDSVPTITNSGYARSPSTGTSRSAFHKDRGEGSPGSRPDRHMTSVLYVHVEDADQLSTDSRAAGAGVNGPGGRGLRQTSRTACRP